MSKTMEELRALLWQVRGYLGISAAREMIRKFGGERLILVPEENYDALHAHATEVLERHNSNPAVQLSKASELLRGKMQALRNNMVTIMAGLDELNAAVGSAVTAMNHAADTIRNHPAANDTVLSDLASRLSSAASALGAVDVSSATAVDVSSAIASDTVSSGSTGTDTGTVSNGGTVGA